MSQKIAEGIHNLAGALKEFGLCRPMLVTDSSYPHLCIRDSIEALGLNFVRFGGFTSNPLYEQVCAGADIFRTNGCDGLVAVGGGSAIDVAKCIKLAVIAREGESCLIPPLVSQPAEIDPSICLPLVAIPTTAGTGSESTHNAVIYYGGAKQTVTSDAILPDVAILEPEVLRTLPLYQKKCTMMDALCQGIESWWSVNSTPESREYSRSAISLIMKHWRDYIFEGDPTAARQIMLAANLGGKAINIAQTTSAHAMSYKLTSMYALPHGHAVAVCLPEIWEYMAGRASDVLRAVFAQIAAAMGQESIMGAIACFRDMMAEMDLANPAATGDRKEELATLAASVNPIRLKNNPIPLDAQTLYALYEKILKQ